MCIQDWRLGRLIRSSLVKFTLGAGGIRDFPASKQRIGFQAAIQTPNISIAVGFVVEVEGTTVYFVNGNTNPYHIALTTHGDLPMRAHRLSGLGASHVVGVVEWFLDERVLQAGIEEFQRTHLLWGK